MGNTIDFDFMLSENRDILAVEWLVSMGKDDLFSVSRKIKYATLCSFNRQTKLIVYIMRSNDGSLIFMLEGEKMAYFDVSVSKDL